MASTVGVAAASATAPLSSAEASGSSGASTVGQGTAGEVYLLDYGGGNVRSVINAVAAAGFPSLKVIKTAEDFAKVAHFLRTLGRACVCGCPRTAR